MENRYRPRNIQKEYLLSVLPADAIEIKVFLPSSFFSLFSTPKVANERRE
jgi:hypothetical protein